MDNLDNKLQSILDQHGIFNTLEDLGEAIAAIKQAFLEMESMQDEILGGDTLLDDLEIKTRQKLRQAIRKEVNHG